MPIVQLKEGGNSTFIINILDIDGIDRPFQKGQYELKYEDVGNTNLITIVRSGGVGATDRKYLPQTIPLINWRDETGNTFPSLDDFIRNAQALLFINYNNTFKNTRAIQSINFSAPIAAANYGAFSIKAIDTNIPSPLNLSNISFNATSNDDFYWGIYKNSIPLNTPNYVDIINSNLKYSIIPIGQTFSSLGTLIYSGGGSYRSNLLQNIKLINCLSNTNDTLFLIITPKNNQLSIDIFLNFEYW